MAMKLNLVKICPLARTLILFLTIDVWVLNDLIEYFAKLPNGLGYNAIEVQSYMLYGSANMPSKCPLKVKTA
jgi:hypothetical protein